MTDILISLNYSEGKTMDLALPANVPSQLLAYGIAKGLNVPYTDKELVSLGKIQGGNVIKLRNTHSLNKLRVLNGFFLKLLIEPAPAKGAFLTSSTGLKLLVDDDCLIGRDSPKKKVNIDLSDINRYVSREHAHIRKAAGKYSIVDMKSNNGTCVNGENLIPERPITLQHGDEIRFGSEEKGTMFKFVVV